jgi:hypothetical protein
MIRRALRRMRNDEAGLSLVELLVSGLLTVGIMAMIGTMFIQTAKITTQSTQTTNSNNVAANIATSMTNSLRVATSLDVSGATVPAPAIAAGNRESVTFYAYADTVAASPAPVRIRYYIDPAPAIGTDGKPHPLYRTVVEERCTAVPSGGFFTFAPCAATTTRNLGGQIQALTGTTDQMFTYYKADGSEIIIAAGDLTLAQRQTVAAVRVYVSVKAPGSETKKVVISNKVVLGNLGLDNS